MSREFRSDCTEEAQHSYRCFIGVPLDEELLDYCQSLQNRLRTHCRQPDVRWVEECNLHLTLAFLGQQNLERLRTFADCFRKQLVQMFAVPAKHLAAFPDAKSPILALECEANEALMRLKAAVDSALQQSDIVVPDPHLTFRPHITLARAQRAKAFSTELLQREDTSVTHPVSLKVRSVVAYHSQILDRRVQYSELERFQLRS